MRIPKGLIEETKAMVRLYLFLRHDCGLREADRLSAGELRELLGCICLSKRKRGGKLKTAIKNKEFDKNKITLNIDLEKELKKLEKKS